MKNFNQKLLSASVSMLMTVSICHVATTQASDIEIYKLPDQTKLSIFMMLDLSGSMDRTNPNSGRNGSCDTPSGVTIQDFLGVYDAARDYTRNYCLVGASIKYHYFDNTAASGNAKGWYKCNAITNTPTTSNCTKMTSPASPSNADLADLGYTDNTTKKYYASSSGGTKYPDRLSRLKDALYNLATSDDISPHTQIGVGTFVPNDGKRGYVVIKSDLWGAVGSAQRQKVLDLIKDSNFKGLNNTPTATSYAESAAYLLGTTTKDTATNQYSGIGLSGAASGITTGSGASMKYVSPLDKITEPLCSGKGIYFLTDGEPNGVGGSAKTPMKLALNLSSDISTSGGLVNTNAAYSSTADWEYIGAFAKYLNNGSNLQQFFSSVKNNNQHVIKTAVVGFGSVFDIPEDGIKRKRMTDPKTGKERTYYDCSKLTGRDQQNACNWGMKSKFSNGTTTIAGSGGYGEGGFYSAQNTDEVVASFVNFVDDMKPEFNPVPTGSPTVPVDALNPIQLQPYGYYASFTPKPQENYQLWLGNLNKYHVYKGELYNSSKTIKLIQSSGELNSGAYGIWGTNGGGVLEKLPLGTWTNPANATQKSSNRKVFTNREINTSNQAIEATSLQSVNLTTLFASGTDGKLVNDPKKNYWLNILGYKVAENATGLTINTLPTEEQRQLGAVMHSKPILLTQEGKIVVTKDTSTPPKPVVTTTARQDYLLFGTNQGMLHVVKVGTDTDTDRGEEVFTFVPHEMMEKQYKGFLSEGNTNLGRDNLYYGIDGAWTAYSQYVSKTGSASTLTVKGKNDDGDDLSNQAGLQLVYGGLRMGGRGYYSLDLRTITSPTLKFHINPDAAAANTPLSYMGQSWSKPTIAWVNWGGAPKLVMFVGGGYDAGGVDGNGLDASGNRVTNGGYENPAYEQTNKKGAGVYMFDANDGSLLWWSSANVGTSTSATTDSGTIATNDDNLKYSVVSQINAVDRDGDGLVDYLYFGDLGGQAFRIDLNNKASTLGAFAKRVVRLYNAHVTTGASPRFYEMPSFSVHTGVDGYFGAVALSSGNRSSPLAGTNTVDGSVVTTITANDGVYVIYDNDVARKDLYDDITLRTSPTGTGVTLTDASAFATLKAGIAQKTGTNYNGGWKYQFHTTAGKYKGMNELYALDNMLYVNVYHKDGTGISGDCGSGVKGDTELYQFCLPTGKCPFEYPTTATDPNKIVLGGGILGTGLGVGYSNKLDEMSIIKGKEGSDCTDTANKNKPECQLFDTGSRLQHLRWYESR